MTVSYRFSNLLSVPYGGGSFVFTEDGNALITAAGNRAHFKDLVSYQTFTLGVECRQSIDHILLRPNKQQSAKQSLVVLIDEAGSVLYLNLSNLVPLARLNLRCRVSAAAVSPNGAFLALAYKGELSLWRLPCKESQWHFSRVWEQKAHTQRITSVQFSLSSNYLVTASEDTTVRVWCVEPPHGKKFIPLSFIDNSHAVVFATFSPPDDRIYSVGYGGAVFAWLWNDTPVPEGRGMNRAVDIRPSRFLNRKNKKDIDIEKEEVADNEETGVTLSPNTIISDEKEEGSSSKPKKMKITEEQLSRSNRIFTSGWWSIDLKMFLTKADSANVGCCSFCPMKSLLAIGLTNGVFSLLHMPEGNLLYNLSVDSNPISSLSFNPDGEWIAIGVKHSGQFLVWEWKSETRIWQETGDVLGVRSVKYMPSSQMSVLDKNRTKGTQERLIGTVSRNILASGTQDGKIRLWDATTGFTFHTFKCHTAAVTSVCFTPQLNAVISISLDGTVQAHDLLKYKTFRTMRVKEDDGPAAQLGCLSIDASGEIISAGSSGSDCRIFLWSLQTGKLLEAITAHEEPITGLDFSQNVNTPGLLASTSLDGSLRLWDVFGRVGKAGAPIILKHTNPAMSLAWDPRCNQRIAVAYSAGQIIIWDIDSQDIIGQIEGIRDISIDRLPKHKNMSNILKKADMSGSNPFSRDPILNFTFSSIAYAAHGEALIAVCKESPKVCIYSTDKTQLVFSFMLTHNRSLDLLWQHVNSKMGLDGGMNLNDLGLSDEDLDIDDRKAQRIAEALSMPGNKLNTVSRRKRLVVWGLCVTPDSQELAIATSHGIFSYCMTRGGLHLATKNHVLFQRLSSFAPVYLDSESTTVNCLQALNDGHFARALRLALGINDKALIARVYQRITQDNIPLIVKLLPTQLIPALLNFIRICLGPTDKDDIFDDQSVDVRQSLQVHTIWLINLLWQRSETIQDPYSEIKEDNGGGIESSSKYAPMISTLLLLIMKYLREKRGLLQDLFQDNHHLIAFLIHLLSDTSKVGQNMQFQSYLM